VTGITYSCDANPNGSCAHDSTTGLDLTYFYVSAGSANDHIAGTKDSMKIGRDAAHAGDALIG
jgi:hypothetical protein